MGCGAGRLSQGDTAPRRQDSPAESSSSGSSLPVKRPGRLSWIGTSSTSVVPTSAQDETEPLTPPSPLTPASCLTVATDTAAEESQGDAPPPPENRPRKEGGLKLLVCPRSSLLSRLSSGTSSTLDSLIAIAMRHNSKNSSQSSGSDATGSRSNSRNSSASGNAGHRHSRTSDASSHQSSELNIRRGSHTSDSSSSLVRRVSRISNASSSNVSSSGNSTKSGASLFSWTITAPARRRPSVQSVQSIREEDICGDLAVEELELNSQRGDGNQQPLLSPPREHPTLPPLTTNHFQTNEQGRPCLSWYDVEASSARVAKQVLPWTAGDYSFVKELAKAPANQGTVELRIYKPSGQRLAVKRLPNSWMTSGPKEFAAKHPVAREKPWADLGFLVLLNGVKYPYLCQLLAVFKDDKHTYIVMPLAKDGDLHSWIQSLPPIGDARECRILPVTTDICAAIGALHAHNISHRDISLENIVIHGEKIQIIDFGIASATRLCRCSPSGVGGKEAYEAPETLSAMMYDAFLADEFAVGVTLFALAADDTPWTSTRSSCKLFQIFREKGFHGYLQTRKLVQCQYQPLSEVLSTELSDTLGGLLELNPAQRLCLGETCYNDNIMAPRATVYDRGWIKPILI
eukprot:TRINITY_DN33378_c0_g1_i1.p1 TRINITY_DN33378_c0_g1~~TRINITY_DN33378_c0_g1_i1.p1  ORF type:complete len:647 (+),score=84.53 TRINITY_DN33378_c0_g1_i1:57-1943(+)